MEAGNFKEEKLGFKEEDTARILFGEEIMEMADGDGFDGSEAEHQIFMEIFYGNNDHGASGAVKFELDEKAHSKVVESSLLSSYFHAEDSPNVGLAFPTKENEGLSSLAISKDQHLVHTDEEHSHCLVGRDRSLLEVDSMKVDSDFTDDLRQGTSHAVEACDLERIIGTSTVDDSVVLHVEPTAEGTGHGKGIVEANWHMQDDLHAWQQRPGHVVETSDQGQMVGISNIDYTMAFWVQAAAEGAVFVQKEAITRAIEACGQEGQMTGIGEVDDPMHLDVETAAQDTECYEEIVGTDLLMRQSLRDQQTCDQGQMVDTRYIIDSMALSEKSADNGTPCCRAIGETAVVPYVPQTCLTSGELVALKSVYHIEMSDTIISSQQHVEGCSSVQSGTVGVASKRTLNRELPEQLEAHAHWLLKDAGWKIDPRKRSDRAKMASYFTAPHRAAVFTSLSQAWKFCGQRLYDISSDSERGKYAREWSDANTFWKDLTNTMAYIGEMMMNQENSLSLLERWQLLDPFIAVVFINKKVSVLRERKTLRAVDSSTFVLGDRADSFLPSSQTRSVLLITDSEHTPGAIQSSNGHKVSQFCHNSQGNRRRPVKPKFCRMQDTNCEASKLNCIEAINHVYASDELGQTYPEAKLSNNSVKRVRKKSKRISEIEATESNGLCAGSCIQACSVHLHEKTKNHLENVLCQESNLVILDSSNSEKVHVSKEPGAHSTVEEFKKRLKSKTKLAKLNAEDKRGICNISTASETMQGNTLWSEDRIQEVMGCNGFCENYSEESLAVSNDSNVLAESSHEYNATVLVAETGLSLEAQSTKKVSTKNKLEGWKRNEWRRPRGLHINDDDLLITAIIKNKDLSSCGKFASSLGSSEAKKFRKLKSPKRGCKLLVRKPGKAGHKFLDGKRLTLARKTVLCWLIASGFIALKDVVQYRNLKNNEVVKDGWVTWDGILCNCCSKILSVSDFKAHAGSNLPKSSLNLFLQSGKSYTLCQLEAWSAECMERRSDICVAKAEEVDENDDTCGFCGDGGELLCCDNCPSTYHQACLSAQELPEGSWYCHNCICQSCGYPVSEKEVSSFSAILKCLQCGHAYHDTCIERDMMCYEDVASDAWFCGRNCKEIFSGLRTRVGIENFLDNGFSWTILRCNSGGQKLHSAQKIALMAECNTKLAVALTLMEECFVQMVDPRTGIDIIPHVLYNRGSNFARLNYHGFYTVILEKGDEILCVASVRVHGTTAAELPFIATCAEYRRQGMCRRLMDTIEKMLRSFGIRMVVLSAIPELVSTWVSGFGFKPIEEEEKKQLNSINLMLFPGASLLTKILYKSEAEKSGEEKDLYDISGLLNGKCSSNGKEGEHWEVGNTESVDMNSGKVAVDASARSFKDECSPARWHHSTKLAIGEV